MKKLKILWNAAESWETWEEAEKYDISSPAMKYSLNIREIVMKLLRTIIYVS